MHRRTANWLRLAADANMVTAQRLFVVAHGIMRRVYSIAQFLCLVGIDFCNRTTAKALSILSALGLLAIALGAAAQAQSIPPPPVFVTTDENGVDLALGGRRGVGGGRLGTRTGHRTGGGRLKKRGGSLF